MIHAVADTNTAISGLLTSGTPAGVLRLAHEQRLRLWACAESISEFRRVVRYPHLEKRIAALYRGVIAFEREYERLLSIVSIEGIEPGVLVPTDRSDEMFIRVAVAAQASFIITRDPHLLDLVRYEDISIVKPEEFMRAWHAVSGESGRLRQPERRWKLTWRRKRPAPPGS
jgi:uncharacterized protein